MPTRDADPEREYQLLALLPPTPAAKLVRHCLDVMGLTLEEAWDVTREAGELLSAVKTLRDGE